MTTQPTSKSLVLITGASGFLGSYLVDSYVERGIPVRALLRPSSSQRYLKHHVQAGHVELAFGTMGEPDSLRTAVDGVTHIVHSAAVIGGPGTPWSVYQRVNIDGTAHLLRAAESVGVQRFTLISSVATYGNHTLNGGPVTEETPQEPSNPYGQSKLAQQELVLEAERRFGLPVVLLEPPVIYGPRARVGVGAAFNLVKYRLAPLLDGGWGRIKLVYVTDVARLVAAADATEASLGQRFLAAGPRFVTQKEILYLAAASWGVRPLYFHVPLWPSVPALTVYNASLRLVGKKPFFQPRHFLQFNQGADYRTEKAQRVLGWVPQVDLHVGIPETAAWFKAEG